MGALIVGDYFDTDLHTLSDGALSRFMKMRKWLVLTAVAIALLQTGLLDFDAVRKALFVSALQQQDFHWFLTGSALWQAAMLVLVLAQVANTYRDSLRVRRGWKENRNIWYTRELRARRSEIVGENGFDEADLKDTEWFFDNPGRRMLLEEVHKIDRELPRQKMFQWFVLVPEIAIDLMRILPVTLFFFYSLIFHGAWWGTAA